MGAVTEDTDFEKYAGSVEKKEQPEQMANPGAGQPQATTEDKTTVAPKEG